MEFVPRARRVAVVLVGIFLVCRSLRPQNSGCGHEGLRGTGCGSDAKLTTAQRLAMIQRLEALASGGDGGLARADAVKPNATKKEAPKKMELNETGSPTNEDIKTLKKQVQEKSKVHQLPLPLRLIVVATLLSVPLMIVGGFMYAAPAGDLTSNIYVKTSLHCAFSFTVGWINCVMLLRYRVFATMMVGNTILMGVAFICNGGFHTAEENDFWYMGTPARKLCPAQFDNAGHYAIMIILFMFGSVVQGFMYKKFGWSSRPFAPIVALGIFLTEVLEHLQVISDSRYDVYLLAPVFGMFVSISAHCGVGSVPWAATGHMVSAGFKVASYFADFNYQDIRGAFVNFCLWTSFVLGIMMGTYFHSNRTMLIIALSLQALLFLNGVVHDSKQQTQESLQEEEEADPKNGVEAADPKNRLPAQSY